ERFCLTFANLCYHMWLAVEYLLANLFEFAAVLLRCQSLLINYLCGWDALLEHFDKHFAGDLFGDRSFVDNFDEAGEGLRGEFHFGDRKESFTGCSRAFAL